MYFDGVQTNRPIFSIAPMMDWTDRHCRYFHRLLTKHALLYTEMVVADAIIHGDRDYLLGFNDEEHPLALQLGGSDPQKLAQAAKVAHEYNYDEINLNVGCPSDRVQSGTFGACLMREPELVARCVAAMKEVVDIPVTVKCRIGVDDQDTEAALNDLAHAVWKEGADALWVHARKAWLEGLSPKENRDIPPLDYDRVHRLKSENLEKFVGINGGIADLDAGLEHTPQMDGIMLGRAAYQNPSLLRNVDQCFYDHTLEPTCYSAIIDMMCDYAENHVQKGGKLNQITRHMIGLFQAMPGARGWRQTLSVKAVKAGAGPEVIQEAYAAVSHNIKIAA